MFTSADEVLSYLKKEAVEMVDVRFCDLPGVMQHFTVPVSSFNEDVFTDGLGFDGSSIRGFQQIHESDMLLLPDPTTARLDPFRTRKTLIINFFIHDPLTGEAYSRDPRNVAKKLTISVLRTRNGSMRAVVGSGSRSMSDSWISWNPRIDDPSNPRPSVKTSCVNDPAGTVKCCITPGRSQKRTSTISTASFLM